MTEDTSSPAFTAIDPEVRRQAIQEAMGSAVDTAKSRRSLAAQADTPKPVEPLHTTIGRRKDNLRAAIQKARTNDKVHLAALSQTAGERIELRCRRLTVQQLAASGSLPARADELVSKLIEASLAATGGPNAEYAIETMVGSDYVNQMVQDMYGGWTREAMAAFFEFQAAVCCVSVIDTDYRLVYTQEEVDANVELNVLVWDIPQTDIETIFNWALKQEDEAEATIMPFRNSEYAGSVAQPESGPELSTERSDQV